MVWMLILTIILECNGIAVFAEEYSDVKAAIQATQPQGYHILIKGSNSTRLYQLPELL